MGLVAKYDGHNVVVYRDNRLISYFNDDDLQESYEGAFKGMDKNKSTVEPYAYYYVLPTGAQIKGGWHGFYNMTYDELSSEFEGVQAKMNESGFYNELTEKCKVLYHGLTTARQNVTNFVVLGSGSLTDTIDVTARRRRMEQVATVTYMRRLFRNVTGKLEGLPITFQDPCYSRSDKNFLEFLGFYVANDPDAFTCIDNASLVFNISTSFNLSYRISQGPRPIVLISNMDPASCTASPIEGAISVADMLTEYTRIPFVKYWGDEYGDFGAPTAMYCRSRDRAAATVVAGAKAKGKELAKS